MKKIYILAITIFFLILFILFIFYNRYSSSYEEELRDNYISKNIDILNDNLNTEKRYALSLSLLVSQNESIKNALTSQNHNLAVKEIKKITSQIKNSTNIENIDIQIHTKGLKAFARSWEKGNYLGTELSSFRKGLVKVKKDKKPFVSIELGKRLNIKAISPIFKKNNFIGSVEVILNFKNIEKRLEKFNLDMLVLLEEKHINVAIDIKNNHKIANYYIVEKDFSHELYKILEKNKDFFQKEFFYKIYENKIITFVPMKSIGIQDVGIIVLSMKMKKDNTDTYSYDNNDFENDIYTFNPTKKREVTIK